MFVKVVAVAAVLATSFATTSCQNNKYTKNCTLKNDVDSFSYCLGYFEAKGFSQMIERAPLFDTIDVAAFSAAFAKSELTEKYIEQRKQQFDTLDVESFKYGFNQTIRFGEGKIDETVANAMLQGRFNAIRARKEAERKAKAEAELAKGQSFLAENATKEGVVTTESGLQYKVITMGTGAKPTDKDRVKVLYTGRLLDGTVFDSTDKNDGKPATFGVKGVIKGWTEVLQLMPVGSKFTVYVPAELAYGERGAGENIPGNATLIFDIELLEIVTPPTPAKK